MSGGYRLQLAPGALPSGTLPVEGEPRWDAINRKLGFWNFEAGAMDWFRIPRPGENENYIPLHEWDGTSLKFMLPSGEWGEEVDLGNLSIVGVASEFVPGSTAIKFTFSIDIGEEEPAEYITTTAPIPNAAPTYVDINTNADEIVTSRSKFIRHTGTLTADHSITLSTIEAIPGANIRITRTGSGAYDLNVHALIDLTTNTWADFTFDGSDWYLSACGSLTL